MTDDEKCTGNKKKVFFYIYRVNGKMIIIIKTNLTAFARFDNEIILSFNKTKKKNSL